MWWPEGTRERGTVGREKGFHQDKKWRALVGSTSCMSVKLVDDDSMSYSRRSILPVAFRSLVMLSSHEVFFPLSDG